MRMEKTVTRPRNALDRDAWIHLATDMLADEGLSGLRVEVLAKKLGVTKGSFYWHFKDRQELLQAVLDSWQDGRVREAARMGEAPSGKAIEQIRRVMDLHSINPNRKGIAIELAIRDWARRDEAAAAAVDTVDQARLTHAATLFSEAGFDAKDAPVRALLLYTHAFGLSLMNFRQGSADIISLHEKITQLITQH